MTPPILFARREPTNDSTVRFYCEATGAPLEHLRNWRLRDVVLYADRNATRPVARWPWYFSNIPNRHNRWVMHNCARFALVWLSDLKGSATREALPRGSLTQGSSTQGGAP